MAADGDNDGTSPSPLWQLLPPWLRGLPADLGAVVVLVLLDRIDIDLDFTEERRLVLDRLTSPPLVEFERFGKHRQCLCLRLPAGRETGFEAFRAGVDRLSGADLVVDAQTVSSSRARSSSNAPMRSS